jgi:hypothetical protein
MLTQPTGVRVGPVTDFIGGQPHPRARLLAGTGDVAHDDRYQCPRNTGAFGDVFERRSALHDAQPRTFQSRH